MKYSIFFIAVVLSVATGSSSWAKEPRHPKKKPHPVVTPTPTPEEKPAPSPVEPAKNLPLPVPTQAPVQTPVQSPSLQEPTPTPSAKNSVEEYGLLFVQQTHKTQDDPKGLAQAGVGLNYWRYPSEGRSEKEKITIVHLQGAGLSGGGVAGVYVEGDFVQFFGRTEPLMEDGLLKNVTFAWGTGAEMKAHVQDEKRAEVLAGISLAGVMMIGDRIFFGPEVALDYGQVGDHLNTKAGLKGKYLSPDLKITGEVGGRTSWREPSAQDYAQLGIEVHIIKLNNLNISVGAQYSNSTIKYLPHQPGGTAAPEERVKEIRLSTAVGF